MVGFGNEILDMDREQHRSLPIDGGAFKARWVDQPIYSFLGGKVAGYQQELMFFQQEWPALGNDLYWMIHKSIDA